MVGDKMVGGKTLRGKMLRYPVKSSKGISC